MATAAAKKPSFPSKTCPKCGDFIHARAHSHEKCGWEMKKAATPAAKPAPAAKKKVGRPAGSGKKLGRPPASRAGTISLADIQAVKALTDRIGAAKVKELAEVLG